MALWVCLGCKTAYSVGAVACPQCGSKKHTEQGAKNDPHLLATDAGEGAEAGGPDA
jgi:hypothetical protein